MEERIPTTEIGFKKGLKDGIAICLGYFPISFAFGVMAVQTGLKMWITEVMNALIYTGSGQLAILNLIRGGETVLFTYALTIFVVNCRYILLSLSLSQRLDPNMGTLQRMLFAFFNSDEIFAVAVQQRGKLKAPYLFGIATLPYIGWITGAILGCLFTDLMPDSIGKCLDMLVYAMYIAIIVPSMKKSKSVSWVVVISIILSVILECNTFVRSVLSPGWIIIICAVIASVVGAIAFPVKDEEEE